MLLAALMILSGWAITKLAFGALVCIDIAKAHNRSAWEDYKKFYLVMWAWDGLALGLAAVLLVAGLLRSSL